MIFETIIEEKRRRLRKRCCLLTVFLTICMCLSLSSCSTGNGYESEIDDIAGALRGKAEIGSEDSLLVSSYLIPGDSTSDWTVIMLGRAEADEEYEEYLTKLKEYVETRYETDEKLSSIKATEWHRISLAVLAAGGDPAAFGITPEGETINLIADGTYMWKQNDNITTQGSNAAIFALLTLDAGKYEIPANANYTRENLIRLILEYQDSIEGGFGLAVGGGSDVDITAMALQALAPYYADGDERVRIYKLSDGRETTIKESVDGALKFLSEAQGNNGMYQNGGVYNSESCAQVIIALCSLGIDPAEDTRFEKTGRNVVDGLLEFKADDGGYYHTIDNNPQNTGCDVMATQQAGCAFTALKLLEEGERYYDFTGINAGRKEK